MRFRALAPGVLVLAGVATNGFAQIGQGRLTGTVTDTERAVLRAVTVTVTSPVLLGQQTAVTQSDGRYLFPALPSGVYTITFAVPNFQTLVREGVVLSLATTITVDAELALAGLRDNVVVTAVSPVVDVATTRVAMNLKGEALFGIPNSTDVWGALAESPGIRMQGFDVGGSHKSQQSRFEAFGIQNQIRVVSDGIDHTEGVGGTGFYEDYFANEEVSVSALGSDVEMNSGGAAIVTTVKSGGNVVRGLEHLSYEPGRWVADNRTPALDAQGFTGNPTLLFWEAHVDLGGPIKRDRLWFFYAFNHFTVDKVVSGVPRELGTDLGLFDNHTAKGTWRPSPSNTLVAYFQQGRKQKPRRGISVLLAPEAVSGQDSYSRMYKGEWQRVVSPRAFLDVTAGRFAFDAPFTTNTDPVAQPPTVAIDTGRVTGAPFFLGNATRSKPQVKVQLTYYLPDAHGSHDLKFGYETIYDWYRFGATGATGPIQYRTRDGVPIRVRFRDVGAPGDYDAGWGPSPNVDLHHAAFAQDRWLPGKRLSVTAGIRVDYQEVSYGSSTRRPLMTEPIFRSVSTVSSQTLVRPVNLAPRLGVAYDLTGDGRTAVKAFHGRYYNNIADSFLAANPGVDNIAEFNFNDLNHNGRYDGLPELGSLRLRAGGASATVNPDLQTPFVEESGGSIEHQFWGESALRFTVVTKASRDFAPVYYSPYVPAWIGQLTVPTTVAVTGAAGGAETYHVFDIPASLAGQSAALFDNIPDSDFHYTTIELALSKRGGRRLFLQVSGDYQWRDELRTADIGHAGDNTPLGTDPIGINFALNPNPAVPNRQSTTTYQLQALGRYLFPRDVGAAVNVRYQSGFPYSRIIPDGELPNLSPAPFFVDNLNRHRSDDVALLNLRLDKTVRVGRAKLTAMLDVSNLLNANPVTNFNLFNDDFGHVIAVLDPRVAQIGLRLEF